MGSFWARIITGDRCSARLAALEGGILSGAGASRVLNGSGREDGSGRLGVTTMAMAMAAMTALSWSARAYPAAWRQPEAAASTACRLEHATAPRSGWCGLL